MRKGLISASGFPAGLKAAPASSFGKENLLRILSDEVIISFAGKILQFIVVTIHVGKFCCEGRKLWTLKSG